jgi:hypothetical protein
VDTKIKEISSFLSASNEVVGEYYLDFLNNIVKPHQKENLGTLQKDTAVKAMEIYSWMVIYVQNNHKRQLARDCADYVEVDSPCINGEVLDNSPKLEFIVYNDEIYHPYELNQYVDAPESHNVDLTSRQVGAVVKNHIDYILSNYKNEKEVREDFLRQLIEYHTNGYIPYDFDVIVKIGMSTYTVNTSIDI